MNPLEQCQPDHHRSAFFISRPFSLPASPLLLLVGLAVVLGLACSPAQRPLSDESVPDHDALSEQTRRGNQPIRGDKAVLGAAMATGGDKNSTPMTPELRAAYIAARQKEAGAEYAYAPLGEGAGSGLKAANPAQGFTTELTATGVRVVRPVGAVTMHLADWGCAGATPNSAFSISRSKASAVLKIRHIAAQRKEACACGGELSY